MVQAIPGQFFHRCSSTTDLYCGASHPRDDLRHVEINVSPVLYVKYAQILADIPRDNYQSNTMIFFRKYSQILADIPHAE